jgi:hypothetical protein
MNSLRQSKLYKSMDCYTACSIAEGFSGEENTEEEQLISWQWLVDTGTCWHLQGWYGRTAMDLLNRGIVDKPIETHKDYYGQTIPGTSE